MKTTLFLFVLIAPITQAVASPEACSLKLSLVRHGMAQMQDEEAQPILAHAKKLMIKKGYKLVAEGEEAESTLTFQLMENAGCYSTDPKTWPVDSGFRLDFDGEGEQLHKDWDQEKNISNHAIKGYIQGKLMIRRLAKRFYSELLNLPDCEDYGQN